MNDRNYVVDDHGDLVLGEEGYRFTEGMWRAFTKERKREILMLHAARLEGKKNLGGDL